MRQLQQNAINNINYSHDAALQFARLAYNQSKSGSVDLQTDAAALMASIHALRGENKQAYQYLLLLKKISLTEKSQKAIFEYYSCLADLNFNLGFFKTTRNNVDSALQVARKQALPQDTAALILLLGELDASELRYASALKRFESVYKMPDADITTKRLALMQQMIYDGKNLATRIRGLDTVVFNLHKENNKYLLGNYYACLGSAYLMNFNMPMANSQFIQASQYFRELKSPYLDASMSTAWATGLFMQNKYDSAIALNQRAVAIFSRLENPFALAMAHTQLSGGYRKIKDTVNAKKHLALSQKFAAESKNPMLIANNQMELAYQKRNSGDERTADSISEAATGLIKKYTGDQSPLIKKSTGKDSLNDVKLLVNLDAINNKIDLIRDSGRLASNSQQLLELETKYKTRLIKDSLQIQNQKLEISKVKQRNLWLTIAGISILAFITGLLLFGIYRQKKRIAKEKKAVENLTGILKHETSRQFGDLKKSIANILKKENPVQQVSKALTQVKTYEMLYHNLFISDGLATISLKNAFQSIFEYHCTESKLTVKPALTINGGDDFIFNKSDYLFQYMNELMANSFEHAFEGSSSPAIRIDINKRIPEIEIIYADNGSGIADENKKIVQGKGMYYIYAYATQNLNGKLEINTDKGTTYKLIFNEDNL